MLPGLVKGPQPVVKADDETEGVSVRRTVQPIPVRVKRGREFQYCVVFGCVCGCWVVVFALATGLGFWE